MRIAIMGAGALGCYYGAKLEGTGAEVTYIARERTVGALRSGGLTVDTSDGPIRLDSVRAETDPAAVGPVDVVIYATKLYDVDTTAPLIAPMMGRDTRILSLQNGVYTEELLTGIYGADHVWGAQSLLPAQVVEAGHVRQLSAIDRIEFGRLDNAQDAATVAFRDRLEAAGVEARIAENTLESLWRKFIMVGSYGPLSTLVRAKLGVVRSCPESWQLYRDLMQEAFNVGQAKGAGMAADQVERHWADGQNRNPEVETSMQFDRERGARLEVDWFSGYIVREGERLGIPTPNHRFAWMALKPWAEGW